LQSSVWRFFSARKLTNRSPTSLEPDKKRCFTAITGREERNRERHEESEFVQEREHTERKREREC